MRINNEIKSRMVAYYHTPQYFPFAFKHKEPRFVLTPSHLFLSSRYLSSRLATASQRATTNPAQMRAKGNHNIVYHFYSMQLLRPSVTVSTQSIYVSSSSSIGRYT